MLDPIRLLICGTGNSAHALVGIISSKTDVELRVLTQNVDKANLWKTLISSGQVTVLVHGEKEDLAPSTINPLIVTNDPEKAVRGCDIIILAVPASLHWKYLTLVEPYIENGCIIVGLPGQCGFEFEVGKVLGQKLNNCIIINFDSLPWVCRVLEFGKTVKISATKAKLVGAVQGDLTRARIADPWACMQNLLGKRSELVFSRNIIDITLCSPNAFVHPTLMYSRWKDWDGNALEHPPILYQGVEESMADLLAKINEEILRMSKRIVAEYPEIDLSHVIPIYEWELIYYGSYIKDKSNLMTTLRTNSGFEGITYPMIKTEAGKYIPDFNHRFLTEDIPFGLVVIRSIAEMIGVPTPYMDKVLDWCQQKIGKLYLIGSKLIGKDLATTRCPQRYGFTTIAQILRYNSMREAAQ